MATFGDLAAQVREGVLNAVTNSEQWKKLSDDKARQGFLYEYLQILSERWTDRTNKQLEELTAQGFSDEELDNEMDGAMFAFTQGFQDAARELGVNITILAVQAEEIA